MIHFSNRYRTAWGDYRHFDWMASASVDGYLFAVANDITAMVGLRQAQEKLIEEKGTLFAELQHRVKNSFLMIMSMIELSQKSLSDSDSSTVLNEIHARISAIAEMYNLLYQSESLNSIRLDLYLAKIVLLTTNLHTNINIESNFEELKCNSDIAIPAGIITTELLTNAIKYAYEAEEKKPIRFSLGLRKNSAIITVSDKGRGLPEDYNLDDPPTLGFKLIKSLAEQIDGKFKVKSGRGTTCSLKFDI